MYDKMKRFLHYCFNVVVVLILLSMTAAYLMINSVLMTRVINDLQLDSYVGVDTGFAVVTLIFLLGWVPLWLGRSLNRPPRYVGKL